MLDVVHHAALDPQHPIRSGLLQRVLVFPMIMQDAIARHHRTGSIRSAAAVDENRPAGVGNENFENFRNGGGRRRSKPLHGDVDVLHPGGLDSALFGAHRMFSGQAQVDHDFDAQMSQAVPGHIGWLASAEDMRIHFVEIGNAGSALAGGPGVANRRTEDENENTATPH